jgi:hypothetical protein
MNEVVIDYIGGNCPVQAEGKIGGKEFYFRARGNHWSISIDSDLGPDVRFLNPEWYYEEPYGDGPYDAGWMSEEEARALIYEAAKRYLEEVKDD